MMTIHDKHQKHPAQQPAHAPAQTASPRIGNQSLEALMRGTQAPSAQNMGHRVDLPDAIRNKMENAFGADLSGVGLYESQAVADAGANAITVGSKIAFAPGKLDFSSSGGQALLGHELSHVVSQARGEVSGTGFVNHHALEARADREGALAAAGESVYTGPVTPLSASSVASAAGPMQASKADNKRRTQAAQKIQGIIDNTETAQKDFNDANALYSYTEDCAKRAAIAELHAAGVAYDENNPTKKQIKKLNKAMDKAEVPGFLSPDLVSFAQYKKDIAHYIDPQDKSTPNVSLGRMHSKSMLKNATHMERLAKDFRGVNLSSFRAASHDANNSHSIGQNASMDANSVDRNLRVNQGLYHENMRIDHSLKRANQKYKWNAVNQNYTATHEMGHMVNFDLASKLQKEANDNQLDGSAASDFTRVSRIILAESLAVQARKDPKMHEILASTLGLSVDQQRGLFDASPDTIMQIADALKTPYKVDTNGQIKRGPNGRAVLKKSALLKELYKGGYTSEYGSTQAAEMYAEAFGDHYRSRAKAEKYANKKKKLAAFNRERNPLSDRVVGRSKELFDSSESRQEFLRKYAIAPGAQITP